MKTIFTLALLIICLRVSAEIKTSDKLIIAISSTPSNLGPLYATDANSQNINRLLYRSLIDFDRHMRPQCDACESFTEDVAEGGEHHLKFKIKRDLTFHDGTRITADAVKNILHLYQDEKRASVFQHAFNQISKFEVTGEYEFEMVFDKFDYDNLPNLTLLKFFKLKPGVFSQLKKEFHPNDYIGSGRYWYESFSDQEIIITANKGFGDKVNFEKMSFKVVKDETTAALKILNQEVDLSIVNMSPRKLEWLSKNGEEKIAINSSQGSNYVYLNINHENQLLRLKKVRQAIAHLIPVKKIINYRFKGYAENANSIFSPSFSDLYQEYENYSYDPETANKLLREVGAKKTGDVYQIDGKTFEFDLIISTNKNSWEVAKIIQNELKQAGIQLNVKSMEWGTFMRRYKIGQFDFVLSQWVGFTGPGILNYIFHSQSFPPNGGNRGRYQNVEFEQMYEKSLFAKSNEERINLIKSAVGIVLNDVAYISLWHPEVTWVSKSCIKNIIPYSNGSFRALYEARAECQE